LTLLDTLLGNCDSLFLQRVDAVATVSIFSTPISITNGVTVAVPAPGAPGLTFKVNSDDLGLNALIIPGFDVLFTGAASPKSEGKAESIVWTASLYPPKVAGAVSFQLANANSLAIDIDSVSGSITTALSPVTAPDFVRKLKGGSAANAILLEGPAATDRLEIGTSFGPVTVALNKIQLVALERTHAVAENVPAPTFTVKLKPGAQGNGGEFRIAGMAVPFNMKLVGADDAWTCHVQLQGTPGLVTVMLTVTRDEGKDRKLPG
jgi:hypothetical protein